MEQTVGRQRRSTPRWHPPDGPDCLSMQAGVEAHGHQAGGQARAMSMHVCSKPSPRSRDYAKPAGWVRMGSF